MSKVNPNNERRTHLKEIHPFCNGMYHNIREDGSCVQCDSMFEQFPLDPSKTLEQQIIEKYPEVTIRN